MPHPIVYGIPNCDSCRKARLWLCEHHYDFRFHDLRIDGAPTKSLILEWCDQLGWEQILNKKSTTFRALSEDERHVQDAETASELIHKYPLLLKRPLLTTDSGCIAGFNPEAYLGKLSHG
jgi:arsenate reductase